MPYDREQLRREMMFAQGGPESTDIIRAVNQYARDVGSGKIAKEGLQRLAQVASAAMRGDPNAGVEMVTMFGPAGIVGRTGAAKATQRLFTKDTSVLPFPSSPGSVLRAQRKSRTSTEPVEDVMKNIDRLMAERRQMLAQFRKEEVARKVVPADSRTALQKLPQDALAVGSGAGTGLLFSKAADFYIDEE